MLTGRVLLTDSDLPGNAAEETLVAAGFTVERPRSTDPDELVAAAGDAVAMLVQWAPISAETIRRIPTLRMISRLGIGYDMIDVDAATRQGVAVANTPGYCVEEVAAHSTALILSQARGLPAYDRQVREGEWRAVDARPMSVRPSTCTVTIVGFGRIGALVAAQMRAIGFRVIVADPYADPQRIAEGGFEQCPIADALRQADIVSLHAPLTEETHHLIDAAAISSMKSSAVVVNTCRGPLVDEDALADALESGRLAGAALDVFGDEPLPATSRLRELDAVQLSPHAAWYSPEALEDLPVHAAGNIVDFFRSGDAPAIVNRDALQNRAAPF